ncbi:MAG: hypothetical protein ACK4RF_07820 [Cyclobacteriaceae bacterium]
MKSFFVKAVAVIIFVVILGMKSKAEDEVELICMRKQHSTKTCHYNFRINGVPYRYIDNGCKESKEVLIKKAREGKLALAKEWKVDCHQQKEGSN